MNRRTGFTLVEILIVVIILGILAAIVIPQFTEASNDARESALASDLQTLRSQLELYKVQHLERYPNIDEDGAADASAANFISRVTGTTHQTGEINAAGAFGPYMQQFPTNPFVTGGNTLRVGGAAAGAGTHGWHWNVTTTQIKPDDADHSGM